MIHLRNPLMVLAGLIALTVVACGGGTGDTTTTAAPGTTNGGEAEVAMENTSFQPAELTVSVGTTVTWTNDDPFAHTTTSEDDVWDSGSLSQGESFSFTFEEPGTYPYICEIHPEQMQASIIVEG